MVLGSIVTGKYIEGWSRQRCKRGNYPSFISFPASFGHHLGRSFLGQSSKETGAARGQSAFSPTITWNTCTRGGCTCPLPRHGTLSGKHSLCFPSRIFHILFWEKLTISSWLTELKEQMHSHGKQDSTSKGPRGICFPWNIQRHTSGFRMGNTCIPVADSFWYLAKLIQLCKV